jgi:hypothetical protein
MSHCSGSFWLSGSRSLFSSASILLSSSLFLVRLDFAMPMADMPKMNPSIAIAIMSNLS